MTYYATYYATMTSKGQLTMPKAVRDALKLSKNTKLKISIDHSKQSVTLRPAADFVELVNQLPMRKGMDPVEARKYMEENYERV